jgi:hypothetical protein
LNLSGAAHDVDPAVQGAGGHVPMQADGAFSHDATPSLHAMIFHTRQPKLVVSHTRYVATPPGLHSVAPSFGHSSWHSGTSVAASGEGPFPDGGRVGVPSPPLGSASSEDELDAPHATANTVATTMTETAR